MIGEPVSTTQSRAPTLRDVAQRANVSVMSVSNVINGQTARVREDTRSRILSAIEELGYRPHRRGRSLRMQREFAIGFMIVHPDRRFLDDPYITEVAAGMSNALAALGYGLMINAVPDLAALKLALARGADVDGLAVMASGERAERHQIYAALNKLHHPLAIVQDQTPDPRWDSCAVLQDDFAGAYSLTRAVLAAGATNLVFACPRHTWPAVERREAGVSAAGAEAQARIRRITCDEFDFAASVAALSSALADDDTPDAIIGANDQIGIAAIRAAAGLGLDVPRDVMVTGFNAFSFRQFALPLITSVVSPAYRIGETVAAELLARLDAGEFQQRERVLPVRDAPGASVR
jgi:LacI family transcriptional regulator